MKKIALLTFVLVLLSTSIVGTQLVMTVSGSTTHHVYPGQSIQVAVNFAQPGDTIFVHSGTYFEHIVINKTLLLVGENKDNTIIDGSWEGIVVYVSAMGVGIENFTIQRSGGGGPPPSCGIYVFQSNNVTIFGNKITNNAGSGVHSVASNSCIIEQNVITNNAWNSTYLVSGVFLRDLNDTTICENYFENNRYGVYFYHSSHNNLKENYMTDNGHSIYLTGSSNNTIANNSVLNSYRGMVLWGSSNNNRIINNALANSTWHNLLIYSSQNCMIISNNFTNGGMGIEIADEVPNPPRFHNNYIYHNSFVDNVVQVQVFESVNIWDDGYPSGGNYWSDYNGTDANQDGIGDTAYIIDVNNQDNYPLMGMFYDFTVELELGQISHVRVISNSPVSNLEVLVWLSSPNEYLQPGDKFIYYIVDGEEGSVGFCRIMIPRVVLNDSYVVLVDWNEVLATELPFSNGTHACLYFTYNHSTHEVVIVPEFSTWTSILPILIVLTAAIAIYKRRLLKTPIH